MPFVGTDSPNLMTAKVSPHPGGVAFQKCISHGRCSEGIVNFDERQRVLLLGSFPHPLAYLPSETSGGCPERAVRDESEPNKREQLIWQKLMPSCLLHSSLPRTKDLRPGETQSSSHAGSIKVRSKHLSSGSRVNALSVSPPTPFPPLVFGQRQSGVS